MWFCCRCGIAVTHVDPYVVLCRAPVSCGDRAYCDCTACGVLCVCGLVVVLVLCRAPVLSSLCVGERDERGSGGRAPRPEWLRAERHEAERCSERSEDLRGTGRLGEVERRARRPEQQRRRTSEIKGGRPGGRASILVHCPGGAVARVASVAVTDLYYGRRD